MGKGLPQFVVNKPIADLDKWFYSAPNSDQTTQLAVVGRLTY